MTKRMVSCREMFRFATFYDYLLMLVGTIGAVVNGVSLAAFAIILGSVLDTLNGTNPLSASALSLNFVYLAIGTFFAAFLQVSAFTTCSERMTIKLREEYFYSILNQEISFFEINKESLSFKIEENSILFREALGEKFALLFQNISMCLGGIIVGFIYLWQLCLVILVLIPFLGFSGYFMANAMIELVSHELQVYSKAGAIVEESLQLIRTVTALGLQENRLNCYEKELNLVSKTSTKQGIRMGLGLGMVFFFFIICYSITFWVGSILLANSRINAEVQYPMQNPPIISFCQVNGQVPLNCTIYPNQISYFNTEADVCNCPICQCGCNHPTFVETNRCTSGGDVMLVFFAVLFGSFALGQAVPSVTAFVNGRIAAFTLFEIIDRKPIISNNDGKETDFPITGDIIFENVAFSYPSRPTQPIFKNLNLHIPAGKRTALIGESGSGKSTCIALLERYYDPTSGRVLLDGHDLTQIRLEYLRKNIGLVSQEPILFGTSILENIRFGKEDATTEEIIAASKEANAHIFIENLGGYSTFITSSLLSGGQKQRIAIARALLKNPKILLLDEATAALDYESEKLVNEAIDKLILTSDNSARTTIVIAHRLSSIQACEKIIVLDRGSVIEEGSHDELISLEHGKYLTMVKLSQGVSFKGGNDGEKGGKIVEYSLKNIEEVPEEVSNNKDIVGNNKVIDDENDGKQENKTDITLSPKKRSGFRRAFNRFAKQETFYLILGILASAVNGLIFPLIGLFEASLIETLFFVNISEILEAAKVWCLAFLGLALTGFFASFFQSFIFGLINGRITRRVRKDLFQHLLSLEMGFFDEKSNTVGNLSAKLAADASSLKCALGDRMAFIVQSISTIIAGFVIAFTGNWQVALLVLALFPAMVIGGALQLMVMSGLASTDKKALSASTSTLTESIHGIRTVQAFLMQKPLLELYLQQLQEPLRLAIRKGLIGGLGFGFSQAVIYFMYALAFYYGSILVNNGETTFKLLNQSLLGIMMSAMSLGQTAAMTPDLAKGSASIKSIFALLDRKSKIPPTNDGEKPSILLGDVKFENIDFSYPTRPEIPILKKFNLHIKTGQTYALVGSSGSGKSTIVSLIERFYDPNEGEICLDGRKLNELNVEWIRNQIGIVSQEPCLFNGTIKENILFGKLSATEEEIIMAAKMANAHDFISNFPEKYETKLQASNSLSGGQKQRIAIARAIIRQPKILLLDEATSALDEESQRVVQDSLDEIQLTSKRTTIIVAHRLSTVRNAHEIVVLQNGVIVEQGSFDELSSKSEGAFHSLLNSQLKQEQKQ